MQKLIHKSKFQENILWIVWTLIIFQTPTKFNIKWGMYLSMMVRQYHGDQSRGSIIKYENLSDYKNLWMIIHIDVYLFVTFYKKKILLIKIHFVLFLYFILLFLNILVYARLFFFLFFYFTTKQKLFFLSNLKYQLFVSYVIIFK